MKSITEPKFDYAVVTCGAHKNAEVDIVFTTKLCVTKDEDGGKFPKPAGHEAQPPSSRRPAEK